MRERGVLLEGGFESLGVSAEGSWPGHGSGSWSSCGTPRPVRSIRLVTVLAASGRVFVTRVRMKALISIDQFATVAEGGWASDRSAAVTARL